MADGDIVTASFGLNGNVKAADSTAIVTHINALFPVAAYDILSTNVVGETGSGSKYVLRIIVVARAIA